MNYKIHRGWIRNLLTGNEIFARKLVVEDEVLFSDSEMAVRVNLVAYSGEKSSMVEFVEYKRRGWVSWEAEVSNAAVMGAADLGPDTLRLFLFRIWDAGPQA